MKQINADIKSGNFHRIYLLYGDESFLKRSYKKQLRASITGGDDINCLEFEGKESDIHAFIDGAETVPFFSGRKLLIAEDTGWLKSGGNDLADHLSGFPDTTCLLFVENEIDKRSRLYKRIEETGYICEMNRQSPRQLIPWAARILAASGKKITERNMELFLSCTGNDMELIRNELDKLIDYLGDREIVSEDDINAVTTVTLNNKIFDMCRAITQKRHRDAIALYHDLLALKEPPMGILRLIARNFHQLLDVKKMLNSDMKQDQIASGLRVTGYVAGKLIRQAREFDTRVLENYVEKCLDMESMIKSGDMPERLAVELLICGEE